MSPNSVGPFDLTYCTNIHPAAGWQAVFANLRQYAPALKERLSPDQPFGLGLRLSAAEAEELLEGGRVDELRAFLDEHGLYVAILNGYVYGSFHRQVIKADVFAPDWRDDARVQYTLRLAEVLQHLLPPGMDGGISTAPLSYKRWINTKDTTAWERITHHLIRVAEQLARIRQEEGRLIHLDIEPEPDGLLETTAETINYFERWLLPLGTPLLSDRLRISLSVARECLLDHVQVCFDTCHAAVEYEDAWEALERYERAGIRVGRVQISSALKVNLPDDPAGRTKLSQTLQPFAESSYLHQVIEQREDGALLHYPDLGDALPLIQEPSARQWRIHFHVPVFVDRYETFGSTQAEIGPVFERLNDLPFTRQLEIETYTWEVLPPALKQDLLTSICREFEWVRREFPAARPGAVTPAAAAW
jgi:sugar phosphate isomerase/epimerase